MPVIKISQQVVPPGDGILQCFPHGAFGQGMLKFFCHPLYPLYQPRLASWITGGYLRGMRKNQKYSKEEMYLAVELWQESGLSQVKFCSREKLSVKTFSYWYRKYKEGKELWVQKKGQMLKLWSNFHPATRNFEKTFCKPLVSYCERKKSGCGGSIPVGSTKKLHCGEPFSVVSI